MGETTNKWQTEDVIALLETNRGRYAAACSLDFSKPPAFYDTFALRDTNGEKYVTQSWPYFRSRESRKALLRHEPVPVASCWNGIGQYTRRFHVDQANRCSGHAN